MDLDNADAEEGFPIGELAIRTGIGVPTLRAWEQRYGYPRPRRLPGGHRRYTDADVDALLEVQAERARGSTLGAALRRAREEATAPPTSLMAVLRGALPDVAPMTLAKPVLRAISRAIEDEAAARADEPVLVGAFQTELFWRPSRARWVDLARTSSVTIVFGAGRRPVRSDRVVQVGIDDGTSLTREWAVVCDSADFAAALVGIERIGRRSGPDRLRTFETLWTVEPHAVRALARAGAALASVTHPEVAGVLGDRLSGSAVSTRESLRSATSLVNRITGHLGLAVVG